MTAYTATELSARIDAALTQLRATMGTLPAAHRTHVYEADDGQFVTVAMSDFEAHEVERVLFGEDMADANYGTLKGRAI